LVESLPKQLWSVMMKFIWMHLSCCHHSILNSDIRFSPFCDVFLKIFLLLHVFWFSVYSELDLLIVQLQFIITKMLDYKSFMQLYLKNSQIVSMITFYLIKSWEPTCFSMLIHHHGAYLLSYLYNIWLIYVMNFSAELAGVREDVAKYTTSWA